MQNQKQTLSFPLSGSQKVKSLPVFRLEGFAAVAAFAFGGPFLAAAEQRLGNNGFGLVRALAHGVGSRWMKTSANHRPVFQCCPVLKKHRKLRSFDL